MTEMLTERFWSKVDKNDDDCWNWIAGKNAYGYGIYYVGGQPRQKPAHRVAYESLVGPISSGLTIDHLCRNRACVNPDHLEPVTLEENKRRGDSLAAQNARKTHCKRGHPLSGDNLWINPNRSERLCKTCNAMRQRETQARKRAAA